MEFLFFPPLPSCIYVFHCFFTIIHLSDLSYQRHVCAMYVRRSEGVLFQLCVRVTLLVTIKRLNLNQLCYAVKQGKLWLETAA